jgi:Flp pilus assembly protein TadG
MTAPLRQTLRSQPARWLRGFARDDDGSMLVFGMSILLIMLMIGGMSVDLMRYEQRRTLLQQTADRSVLAAANLTQELSPTAVVNDYFDKAGLSEYLTNVEVTDGRNARIVRADAEAELKPFFMQMMGIDVLDVPAAATAEQRISNVEIVMVLDVSGSMNEATGGTTKIAALRSAAKEFVDAVKENDTENLITISIVPYNAQVNIPQSLREKFNITDLHGRPGVNCVEFPQAAFDTLTISRTVAYPMYAFSDLTGGTTQNSAYVAWNHPTEGLMNPNASYCRDVPANVVRLPSDDATQLKFWIDGLTAAGNTSTTLGMKWGVALLDPTARPMMAELMSQGAIPSSYAGRPFNWDAPSAMKVIIVMTDGDHVEHTRINDGYKSGPSPIWKSTGDGNYSIQHVTDRPLVAGTNEYYVPHLNTWQATPWDSGAGTSPQNWEQVWQSQRLKWVAWQLYARALGTSGATRSTTFTTWMNNFRSTWMPEATMDSNMLTSCTQAKDHGVVIYGIAYEAPPQGQAVISGCASSSAYYFNAQGLSVHTAFRSIASNISQLRLTQ